MNNTNLLCSFHRTYKGIHKPKKTAKFPNGCPTCWEIYNCKNVFFGIFNSIDDIIREFDILPSELENAEIIYAQYEYEDYSGKAFVIFVKNGLLYEVNGSHCSCNGLADIWSPEETIPLALLSRPNVPLKAKENIRKFYKDLWVFV